MRLNDRDAHALLAMAGEADARREWEPFAHFCRAQGRGLRRDALHRLDAFLEMAELWPFDARREFVAWLADRIERFGSYADGYPFLPHPLATRLFVPTLLDWTEREPTAALPHRWLGLFGVRFSHAAVRAGLSRGPGSAQEHLRRALELDPDDQPARVRLVELLLGSLDYAVHHLPDYYIGDPATDLLEADEAARLIAELADRELRVRLSEELTSVRRRIEDWIAFRASGQDGFAEWCQAHGRAYRWNTHYYYDDGPSR